MNRINFRVMTRFILMTTVILFLSGCNSVYYKTMEQFGKEKG